MQLTTRAPPADRPTTTIVLRRRNIIASNEKIYFDDNPAATVAKNDNETTAPPATPPNHPPAHSREGESGRPCSYIGIPSPWRRLPLRVVWIYRTTQEKQNLLSPLSSSAAIGSLDTTVPLAPSFPIAKSGRIASETGEREAAKEEGMQEEKKTERGREDGRNEGRRRGKELN